MSAMERAEGSMSQMTEEDKSEEKMAQVSVMEVAEGSMYRMAEENKSEEMMAQASVLQQLFDRISSPPISELVGRLKLGKGLLKTWETNLPRLDAILDDAESNACGEVQLERPFGLMSSWTSFDQIAAESMVDLKAVCYDLEDLLDEIATERLRHQFESKLWNIETYLEKIISPKIRVLLERLSNQITILLERGKEELHLIEASRILRKPYPLSAAKDHLEDESQLYGRDEDKEAIIKLLLSDNETDDRVTVIPIVGEDGVGKTTLAGLVCNDNRVSEHFDLIRWASLSKYLGFREGLIKAVSEAFGIVDSINTEDKLNKTLNMKKFLLVLDDVPYSRYWDPEKVHTYISKGAKGSKILLTAGHSPSIGKDYNLKPLNSDSSWMLFVKHAFADEEIGVHLGLEAIGKKIVTKCHGLPLLTVTLGAMLRFEPSVEEWEAVLRKLSDLDTKKNMTVILRMSYDSLPPNLKRCFAYCSIFPKDHEYDKEKLVLLWMAEGFLQHSKHRRIEEVGHEYFDDLTFRSFFQKSGANSSRFVMHSRLHELARSVSEGFCFSFLDDSRARRSERVRHLSLNVNSDQKLTDDDTSHLRTLLLYYLPLWERSTHLSDWHFNWLNSCPCLRVLSFSHHTITKLPVSIGECKLLRYLDLSHAQITRLPEFVTTLCNLQTLLLSYCHLLSKLPKEFWKLVYLRHLDIRETWLEEMPAKMGCLTSLQSLSDFVVGNGSGSNIRELGPLKNLQGTLCISQLQNVTSPRDASEADLKDKADLKVLELEWSDATANSQPATNVLEKLEPHQNLEKLSIIAYNGISFPDWVGDYSFSKMVFLHLSDCNSCSHLPPLGRLPSLKELIIEGMRGVKKIGPEFFGVNNVSANPFPSLEILVFREMPEWEGWIASEMQPVEIPRLERMFIESCPKYDKNHSFLCLPPSAQVVISVSAETSILPTEETLPELAFTFEKQLHEGDKGKGKQQDRPSTAGLLEVEELQLPDSIVSRRTDVSITSNRPPQGPLQPLKENEKRENVSTMEIVKGSMYPMAGENLSEEKMPRASILQQPYGRISSAYITKFFAELKVDAGLLDNLKSNLLSLDAILDDAESKAYEQRVRIWFSDLKAFCYDLEDLLDEIALKRVYNQLVEFMPSRIKTRVQRIIFPRLEEINLRITRLLQRGKEELHLSEASHILREPYPLSAAKDHIEDAGQLYGRDEDKEAIIKLLLSDNETDDRVTVIPIVGEDGVGKTTLAGLVCNDNRVSEHFNLIRWAYLSQYLGSHDGLIKAFSEAFGIVESGNIKDELNKILNMKKFLLVLDDVPRSWYWVREKVHTYLSKGAKGSKILLTAWHSPSTVKDYNLKPLNSDSSWMLFVKHAFADEEIGVHLGLEAIGKNIVTKCHGLPLLTVTLGAMLRFEPSVEEWEAVLRKLSDLDTKEDMTLILRMSYDSLPPNLKRCFAYCSIFPKDHEYDKEKLVLLWMAEGFLQHSKHRRIEEVGHEYFDDLTSRSFFQKSGANSSRFVMHSHLHELARSVSGEFCFSFFNDTRSRRSMRVRHLSLRVKSDQELTDYDTSHLRTLWLYYLPPEESSTHLSDSDFEWLNYCPCLRVLSFSHHTITKLPVSIGELNLLRYLDLSHTKITRLPDCVTTLYNLQTLLLPYCHSLAELPTTLMKLSYLRPLDVRETWLEEMPAEMGCLTNLQSLSDFVVGEYSGSNIRELGPLKSLGGTLRISRLQNVVSDRDAAEANLKNKADLKVLELKWSDATANSQHATNVLEKLEPHRSLEKLSIISYNGMSFPDWIGDSSYSKMVFLHLSDCNSCSHLPPLGQLPSLKELIIEKMRGVKKIGPELFGVNNVSANPFPSLEILVFREMPEWEGWIDSEMQPVEFPCLKRMHIISCPKYENHSSLCLPPSARVEISVSEEASMFPTEETVPELPDTVEKQLHEGDKAQLREKEKLQGRPSTEALLEVEKFQLPDSNVLQATDFSFTLSSPAPGSLQGLTEDSSAKQGSASENRFTATDYPSHPDTDDPINDEGNKAQFRRNEKLLDVPSTSRLPEELHLPDSNVVQPTDVPNTSNSSPSESPLHFTEDSTAKHGGASDSFAAATETSSDADYSEDGQEDISGPEQESLNPGGASTNSLAAIGISSDTDYSEDSREDISSPEQESMKVSQISQLESLPPMLYSLEIEVRDALQSLPADLNMLHNLQHLYIINCHSLKSIQASHLPEALKNLYIRKCKGVEFLSTAGEHEFLENLCIESSCDSLESFPLAIFPKLRSLSIWNCEKFNSLSITEDHTSLDALEIRNCAQFICFPEEKLRIPKLTSILLSNCKNLKVLPGQLHGLTSLQSLFINECPEVESVPEGGLSSSLNLVCISLCHKLTPCIEWGLHKLNEFSRIEIEDGSKDLESFPEQNLLPQNLISLRISRLPNLKVLDYKGLKHLTCLETLKINSCKQLHSLPDEGLPSSLSYLYISDCPLLNSKLQSRRGKEWLQIAHIPCIQIDGKVIS